jgi:hypothetical protein
LVLLEDLIQLVFLKLQLVAVLVVEEIITVVRAAVQVEAAVQITVVEAELPVKAMLVGQVDYMLVVVAVVLVAVVQAVVFTAHTQVA